MFLFAFYLTLALHVPNKIYCTKRCSSRITCTCASILTKSTVVSYLVAARCKNASRYLGKY